MPLPTRKKGENKKDFISRCMSFMSKKGEGKNRSQRFAICQNRASSSLTDEEYDAISKLIGDYEDSHE